MVKITKTGVKMHARWWFCVLIKGLLLKMFYWAPFVLYITISISIPNKISWIELGIFAMLLNFCMRSSWNILDSMFSVIEADELLCTWLLGTGSARNVEKLIILELCDPQCIGVHYTHWALSWVYQFMIRVKDIH